MKDDFRKLVVGLLALVGALYILYRILCEIQKQEYVCGVSYGGAV